jgi:hypothetical protein
MKKIARERIKNYVYKQMYVSANNENAIALKYFNLSYSAVCRFRKVNSCLMTAN